MKKILPFIFVFALLAIACERTGHLRLPEHEIKLVVNAQWNPGIPMWVHLSRSYGTTELVNNNDLLIPDATVSIWENGVKLEDFIYRDTSRYELNRFGSDDTLLVKYGQYMHPARDTVKPGSHYQLRIHHPDYDDIVADCRVPTPVKIDTIRVFFDAVTETDLSNASTTYHIIEIQVDDPPGEDNYYGLNMTRVYTSPDSSHADTVIIHENIVPLVNSYGLNTLVPAGSIVFSDEGHDGEQISKLFYVIKRTQFSIQGDPLIPERYIFHLYSMNKSLAGYFEGRFKQDQELDQDNLLYVPGAASVSSNIEGGYGVFGAEVATTYTVSF
ncbi:MAG: DUF4249 domain-containing protein [Bacteroidia bacterium]